MIIIGAKVYAIELADILLHNEYKDSIYFYDDINNFDNLLIEEKYKIITSEKDLLAYTNQQKFDLTLGLGNPLLRKKMHDKFIALGGVLQSTISKNANISKLSVNISNGANIFTGAHIANNVKIGKASIVYYNAIITQDCILGDFIEISPGAILLGKCQIGDFTHIGAGTTILPNIKIGKNAIIGAGAVVTKDVPDNQTMVGVPAKSIKNNKI
jgi:sugar O-acyltransferase (sialic acid O-acetyltransferase NeuD family)